MLSRSVVLSVSLTRTSFQRLLLHSIQPRAELQSVSGRVSRAAVCCVRLPGAEPHKRPAATSPTRGGDACGAPLLCENPDRGIPYAPIAVMIPQFHGMGLGFWDLGFANGSLTNFSNGPPNDAQAGPWASAYVRYTCELLGTKLWVLPMNDGRSTGTAL